VKRALAVAAMLCAAGGAARAQDQFNVNTGPTSGHGPPLVCPGPHYRHGEPCNLMPEPRAHYPTYRGPEQPQAMLPARPNPCLGSDPRVVMMRQDVQQRLAVATRGAIWERCVWCGGNLAACWPRPGFEGVIADATGAGPRAPPSQPPQPLRGKLRAMLDEYNAFVDHVPGLRQVLLHGSAITDEIAAGIRDEYDPRKHDAAIHLLRDAILGEPTQFAALIGKLGTKPATIAEGQLVRLLTAAPDKLERELVPIAEQAEQATARAVQIFNDGNRALRRAVNPNLIDRLRDQGRGANPRINRIMYWAYQLETVGHDVPATLTNVLQANGFSGAGLQLVVNNLMQNFNHCKQLGVFTDENLLKLRAGGAALVSDQLGNIFQMQVDHIVPINAIKKLVSRAMLGELGTNLANLRLTPAPLNQKMQDVITEQALDYAEQMFQAGLIRSQQVIDLVRDTAMRQMRARFHP
jgi:hypothetical protein